MAERGITQRRSFRKIKKSRSTGTLGIEETQSVSLSALVVPARLSKAGINLEKYKIKGSSQKADTQSKEKGVKRKSSFVQRMSDTLRNVTKSETKTESEDCALNASCGVDQRYFTKDAGHTPIKCKNSAKRRKSMNNQENLPPLPMPRTSSPISIPSWPQSPYATSRRIIDPLAKPDKIPHKFILNLKQEESQESPELLRTEAGHTPPVPNRWQIRAAENPARAQRLAEANRSYEAKRSVRTGLGTALRTIARNIPRRRKSSTCSQKNRRMSMDKSHGLKGVFQPDTPRIHMGVSSLCGDDWVALATDCNSSLWKTDDQ